MRQYEDRDVFAIYSPLVPSLAEWKPAMHPLLHPALATDRTRRDLMQLGK
jgi:hypothetical protein